MNGFGIDITAGGAAAHPALDCLIRVWSGLAAAAGGLPRRAEIDPRGIEPALPHAFVAERIAPGLARFRLAGHRLAELMGMDLRGMPLSALIEPDDRDAFRRLVAAAFETPAMVRARIAAGWGLGRPALGGGLLLLPLRDEAGGVTRLLGGLVAEGSPGRAPRRFRIAAAEVAQVPGPAEAPPASAARPGTAGAPLARPAGGAAAGRRTAARPALRLVWSAP